MSSLKFTLVSIILNITPFDSLGYICDLLSIFTFSDVGLLTPYQDLDSWCCFLPQEYVQRGELLLITI